MTVGARIGQVKGRGESSGARTALGDGVGVVHLFWNGGEGVARELR